MKFPTTLTALATLCSVHAQYSGDIVQYWVDQSAILVNGFVINGLPSPPSGWFEAIVQGAVYLAATNSQKESLAFQQLAVSHVAHDSLHWTFHGTRLYATIDEKFRVIADDIGLDLKSDEAAHARDIGESAAVTVTVARANDGIHHYVAYKQQPEEPCLYQGRPGGPLIPDTPQSRYLRPFGGLGDISKYRDPPPPAIDSPEYEDFVIQVHEQGGNKSTARSEYDTDTAWYWLESSPIYFYSAWRPITAIHTPLIYLSSGTNISDPTWTPLLNPTPNHQDYLSTHATFGAAAGAVIRLWNNGSDEVDIQLSSNVSRIERVITRKITSIGDAVRENADSRVFGGIHFQFASDVGNEIGDWVGSDTWEKFDEHWDQF